MRMSFADALDTLKDVYSRATSTYVELWEWEAEQRALEEEQPVQPHNRAGSLPVMAPQPDEGEPRAGEALR